MKTKFKAHFSSVLRRLGACDDAIVWATGKKTAAQAWRECERGDWMLWIIGRMTTSLPWSEERKPLLACCLKVAEQVKHLWLETKERQVAAFKVLRKWIKGKATVEEAKAAREELLTCRRTTAAAAAAAAAAYVAADVADAAAYAAAAAYVAADVADAAARKKSWKRSADIVREFFPNPPKEAK